MKKHTTHELSPAEHDILKALQSGKNLQESFAPMIKRVMEAALQGEMEAHLESEESALTNRRNGKTTP